MLKAEFPVKSKRWLKLSAYLKQPSQRRADVSYFSQFQNQTGSGGYVRDGEGRAYEPHDDEPDAPGADDQDDDGYEDEGERRKAYRRARREWAEFQSKKEVGDFSYVDDYLKEWDRLHRDDDCREGLWSLPAVQAYLERINAEPRSLKRAWVVEGEGRYSRDKCSVTFAEDGTVTTADAYLPTEEEQAAICEEAKIIELPKQVSPPDDKRPPELADAPEEHVFAFKNIKGKIVAWQERGETKDGKRFFRFWTYYNDGKWRKLEPEGGLPIYGLEQLKNRNDCTVYLHEGAKAARAMQNIQSDHPWHDELHGAVHLGWVGGAPNPQRTDWEPLRKASTVKRIVIVPDNDKVGRSAVKPISRTLNVPTYVIQFSDEFPVGFDLADDFPEGMFGKVKTIVKTKPGAEKEMNQYVGPAHDACLLPATWLTSIASVSKQGRPSYKLRKSAEGQFAYVQNIDKYACLDRPELRFTSEAMNRMLWPFSDAEPMLYIKKDFSRHIVGLCYRPDREDCKIVATQDGPKLNVYRDGNIKPVKGDVTPFLRFLEHLLPIDEEREFVTRILATLIARPDIAMRLALLLVSETQGTGKSTLGKIAKVIIGSHNCSEPNAETIVEKPYTDWVVYKRLVIVHEIYEGHSWKAYNKIKSKITEDTTEALLRFEAPYQVENYAIYVLCSNALEALKIEDSDRRIYAPRVTEIPLSKKEAAEFYAWLESGGYGIIKQWAMDYGNYLPNHCDVPLTQTKKEMISASKSAIDEYAEMIAHAMQHGKEDNENHVALAVGLSAVFEKSKEKYPKEFGASIMRIKRIMVKNGLAYLEAKVRIDGKAQRVLLNKAAVAVIEEAHDFCYSASDSCFVSKTSGAPVPITVISAYLRNILKTPESLEIWE
jgi:hypothetical protein